MNIFLGVFLFLVIAVLIAGIVKLLLMERLNAKEKVK